MKKVAVSFLLLLGIGMIWAVLNTERGTEVDIAAALQSPSFESWLGKDSLGRDIFTRILQGAEVSILLGLSSSLAALALGVGFGAVSALSNKWIDAALMRLNDILMSLPSVMLMAVLALILQSLLPDHNLLVIFGVLTLGSWMSFARVSRNLILKESSLEYVEAAKAIGAGPRRIFFRHLCPNLFSPLLVYWSLQVPHAILAEGLLSFLGFGVQSPGVSWGALMQEGWKTLASYPHLLLGPAAFLFATVFALNILLETFRRSMDPSLKWDRYS
jgi:oligopeptide transport system permease protein